MKISEGIKNGALLQRDENGFCRCTFIAEAFGEMKTSLGKIEKKDNGKYILSGIPIGGPYNVTLSDDISTEKLTLWVGDLWILGGQSNMEGAGKVNSKVEEETENASENIRSYYMDDRWEKAVPVIHEPWLSKDEEIGGFWRNHHKQSKWNSEYPGEYQGQKCKIRAVGPGYYFAKRMYEITKIPQGVIPCALGGSNMEQWTKIEGNNKNLYAIMLRRFHECGGFVKGVFWDQGESETYENSNFTNKMIRFLSDIRKDFNNPELPFVQVQIAQSNIYCHCNDPQTGIYWSMIKEEQRILNKSIPNLATVAAIDADYDDLIHYSSEFQEKMGIRGANAMANLLGTGGCPVPELEKITLSMSEHTPFCYVLDLHYKNAPGLHSSGRPMGFTIVNPDEDIKKVCNPSTGVQKIEFNGNIIKIHTEIIENIEDIHLYYGFGNLAYGNIKTDTGYAIPAMGPIKIGDYL